MENLKNEFPENEKVFVGRKDCFDKINELFKTKQLVAISAFGGTGKSTLALEYCHRLIEKDSNSTKIRWFNAADSFQFEDDFKELAELLKINIENAKLDLIIRKIYFKLEEFNKEVLFVFDNVETYDTIKEYVGRIPSNIKILITTRDNLVNTKIEKIELEPFNLEETKDFIQKNIDSKLELSEENRNKIIDLSKSTENEILPIKIELVVRYINVYCDSNTIDELLNDIVKRKYLDQKIEATLFLYLRSDNEKAFELLRICSLLNPDFIEKKLLRKIFLRKLFMLNIICKNISINLFLY
jgi:hypothetical protein